MTDDLRLLRYALLYQASSPKQGPISLNEPLFGPYFGMGLVQKGLP